MYIPCIYHVYTIGCQESPIFGLLLGGQIDISYLEIYKSNSEENGSLSLFTFSYGTPLICLKKGRRGVISGLASHNITLRYLCPYYS